MTALLAAFLTFIAGVINGSYALPTKYVKRWPFENTWMVFSVFTFVLTPWLFLFFLSSNALDVYYNTPFHVLRILVVGGLLFGLGQIGFALALDSIGMGLAFVINISLSTALGPLLPLVFMHSHLAFRKDMLVTMLGIIIIIAGLIISYFAGKRRDKDTEKVSGDKSRYVFGVVAAIIAGLGSAGQNYTFASTSLMQTLALKSGLSSLASSFVIWPGFLTVSFVPYALYMLYLNIKNKSFSTYLTGELRFYPFAVLMAACWFGSLVFYSKATQLIGALGPVIIWPLFMSLIILTSNFWGWRFGEWSKTDALTKRMAAYGVALFVVAVMVFGYAAYLSQHHV